MRRQLSEAIPMNGMSTWHFVRRRSTAKEVFLADRTVGSVLSGLAVVIVVQGPVYAHATLVTVLKVLCTSDSTESTIFTMVRCFFIGHPEIADNTMIRSKLHSTGDAIVAVVASP